MRIAIVGSGISGLVCGHLLSRKHAVQVFEANHYIGGHTATIDVSLNGKIWAVDTGFIVFNDRTYPYFQRLLDELGVPYQPTEMSFSVTNAQTGLVYNGHSLPSLFAQRSNLWSPRFYGLLAEIMRFNRRCKYLALHGVPVESTLGQFLRQQGFSEFFARHYILPMGAAIWSASLGEIADFPLKFFIQFFHHHGLLNIRDRPQWYTITGGSKQYIPYFTRPFVANIHLNTPVKAIRRTEQGIQLSTEQATQHFDEVILACHSDQALKLLGDASRQEISILGAIPYRENQVILHHDERLLPSLPKARASWNYHLNNSVTRPASVTYSMNILQCLPASAPPFCVSLNPSQTIDPRKILGEYRYSHPVFSQTMVKAQARRAEICGQRHTHFCGAYWHNGFHEDGVQAAVEVCQRLGVAL